MICTIDGLPEYHESLGMVESDATEDSEGEAIAQAKEAIEDELAKRASLESTSFEMLAFA